MPFLENTSERAGHIYATPTRRTTERDCIRQELHQDIPCRNHRYGKQGDVLCIHISWKNVKFP